MPEEQVKPENIDNLFQQYSRPYPQIMPLPQAPSAPAQQPFTQPQDYDPTEQPQESDGYVNRAINAGLGYIGANGLRLKPNSIFSVLSALYGGANDQSPYSHETVGNLTSAATNNRLSPVKKAVVDTLVPSATRAVEERSFSPLLSGLSFAAVNAAGARTGQKTHEEIVNSGVNATAKTVDQVLNQVSGSLGPKQDLTRFGKAYDIYREKLPKAQEQVSKTSRVAGSGNPTISRKIPENIEFNKTLSLQIGQRNLTLPQWEDKYKELTEGLTKGTYRGGAKLAAERTIAKLDAELPKLRAQVKAETLTEPNKNYQAHESAKRELARVQSQVTPVSDVTANDPILTKRLDEIDTKLSNDTANRRAFRNDPLGYVAGQDLEEYFKGSNQLRGTKKQEALNRIQHITTLRPEVRPRLQRLLITRGLEDINLRDIATGKADMGKVKASVSKLNLTDDAINVIFSDNPAKGRQLIQTLQKLPDALQSATATIDPHHLGNLTIGANGVRGGLFATILSPDAWVNLATKKKYEKEYKTVIDSLNFLSNPSEIKRFGQKSYNPGQTIVILRNVEERLRNAKDDVEPQEPIQPTGISVEQVPRVKQ